MIYIDCGFYVGKALEYYAPFMDKDTELHIFEPNPKVDVVKSMERFPFKKMTWHKEAVWIKDGTAMFNVEERADAARLQQVRRSLGQSVKVKTIDFSKFIADLPEDKIICSMDIEGAEYPVLRKMIDDDTAKRLTLLDIEFHDRLIKNEDEASSAALRRRLEAQGVLVKLKI